MKLRPLGSTGLFVSPLGLGTVKLGRSEGVKYPHPFTIPDDKAVTQLLSLARELGINLIDTAPAYGNSEDRLGKLLPGAREEWVLITKVGERFERGRSKFDFSFKATLQSIERSLRNLKTDYLDGVLIHSDGNDLHILEEEGALDALRELKQKGSIRSHGISTKTVSGGLRAVELCDLVMVACNPDHQDELPVLEMASKQNRGVLIKKGLQSGHVGPEGVHRAMEFIYSQPGVSTVIVGTINPEHLRENVLMVESILAERR